MCTLHALSTARNAGHKAHFRGGASKEGDLIGISCHDGAKATFEKSSSTGKKMARAMSSPAPLSA